MIGTEVLGSGLLLKFWLTRSHLKTLLDMLEKGKPSRRKIDTNYFQYNGYFLGYNSSKDNAGVIPPEISTRQK
jgi:hypothetical protein